MVGPASPASRILTHADGETPAISQGFSIYHRDPSEWARHFLDNLADTLSMAPQYKLYYFPARGRAEVIRQIFHVAGVPYEDIRLNYADWEKAHKTNMPFGQLPVLEVIDGGQVTKIAQSHAISRFLARTFGLNGATPAEEALVEMTADCIEDYCMVPCPRIRREKDPEKKKQFLETYKNTELPQGLMLLERHLTSNGGGDEWFVGSQMTWCDMLFAHWMEWIPDGLKEAGVVVPPIGDYPKLQALVARTRSHPKIVEWLRMRPVSEN